MPRASASTGSDVWREFCESRDPGLRPFCHGRYPDAQKLHGDEQRTWLGIASSGAFKLVGYRATSIVGPPLATPRTESPTHSKLSTTCAGLAAWTGAGARRFIPLDGSSVRRQQGLRSAGARRLRCGRPGGIHWGTTDWEAAVRAVLRRHLGAERRAGGGVYREGERHEQTLGRTSFDRIGITNIPVREWWSIDEIVGYLYSTSYAPKAILGARCEAFEQELREHMLCLRPDCQFEKVTEYTVILAECR